MAVVVMVLLKSCKLVHTMQHTIELREEETAAQRVYYDGFCSYPTIIV